MKNTILFFLAALLITASAQAQSTVDSIAAKYKLLPMPEALTIEKSFPVLGTYQLNAETETPSTVTITIDSANKGLIWVEGLPQGRIKAYLKQSPATYRVLAQKTPEGKQVPEGTLYFDPSTSTLNIALGRSFNEANPTEIFGLNTVASTDLADGAEVKVKTKTKGSKSKSKITFYTATKAEQNTAVNTQQQDQQQQQQ